MPPRSCTVPDFGFDRILEDIEAQGLTRRPVTLHARRGASIDLGAGPVTNFCSNDYLGLAAHPRLLAAWSAAAEQWGLGASASPLVCGRSAEHESLERELAAFTARERVLLFPSGFQANLAVLTALAGGRGDRILMDRLCHASLIDGALLSRASLRRFAHGDPAALQRRLREGRGGGLHLVVTESVFSMDGDQAPLDAYARLSREAGACLYVDDAHGFGVLGTRGAGALEAGRLDQDRVPLLMATFGKALGVSGAFVAGRAELVETLQQRARPYIYSTAMPPAQAAAARAALALLQEEPERRAHLAALIRRFRAGAERLGLPLLPSETPIQPLLLGAPERALAVSRALLEAGFFVAAIRPPTVPAGSARLRITLSAAHSDARVDALLDALSRTLAAVPP